MKSLLLFSILCITLSLTRCKDEDSRSCTDNPTEDLPWLKETIEGYEQTQTDMLIYQVQYKTKTIFSIVWCCHTCEVIPAYFDCNGNELTHIDYTKIRNQVLIWSLPTTACGN